LLQSSEINRFRKETIDQWLDKTDEYPQNLDSRRRSATRKTPMKLKELNLGSPLVGLEPSSQRQIDQQA
jgi:hypothetical protein